MQSIQIQNTKETRTAIAVALAAIDTYVNEMSDTAFEPFLTAAKLELQLIHSAMLIADARKRAAESGARAS